MQLKFSNGDLYEGEVVDNKPHGNGVMYSKRYFVKETNFTSEGDQMYEGEWQNGAMHGKGILIIKGISEEDYELDKIADSYEGKKYVGDFVNGKFEGKGILSFVKPSWTFLPTKSWWKKIREGEKLTEFIIFEGTFKNNIMQNSADQTP